MARNENAGNPIATMPSTHLFSEIVENLRERDALAEEIAKLQDRESDLAERFDVIEAEGAARLEAAGKATFYNGYAIAADFSGGLIVLPHELMRDIPLVPAEPACGGNPDDCDRDDCDCDSLEEIDDEAWTVLSAKVDLVEAAKGFTTTVDIGPDAFEHLISVFRSPPVPSDDCPLGAAGCPRKRSVHPSL
jgi:hypothetical protein